jgi:hypothetical protein
MVKRDKMNLLNEWKWMTEFRARPIRNPKTLAGYSPSSFLRSPLSPSPFIIHLKSVTN